MSVSKNSSAFAFIRLWITCCKRGIWSPGPRLFWEKSEIWQSSSDTVEKRYSYSGSAFSGFSEENLVRRYSKKLSILEVTRICSQFSRNPVSSAKNFLL